MLNIPLSDLLSQMPVEELENSLQDFVTRQTDLLTEQRLRRNVLLAVKGILTNETPVVAAIAQSVSRQEATLPLCAAHGQQLELKGVVLYDREATEVSRPDHCWVCEG